MSIPDRDPLALAMLAAWVNCPVDQLPETMKAHTCEATMAAWKRVGEAAMGIAADYLQEYAGGHYMARSCADALRELPERLSQNDRRGCGV